ncbi:PWWP domain-containing protein [Schizosaccharomyces pombe]
MMVARTRSQKRKLEEINNQKKVKTKKKATGQQTSNMKNLRDVKKKGKQLAYVPRTSPRKSYKNGEYVLAKMSSFPWWPARVASQKSIPTEVRERLKRNFRMDNGIFVQFLPSRDYAIISSSNVLPLTVDESRFILDHDLSTKYIQKTVGLIIASVKRKVSFSDVEEDEFEPENTRKKLQKPIEKPKKEKIEATPKIDGGKRLKNEKSSAEISQTSKQRPSRRSARVRTATDNAQKSPSPIPSPKKTAKKRVRFAGSLEELPKFSLEYQLAQPISTVDMYAQVHYIRFNTLLYYRYQLQEILLSYNHYPQESDMSHVHQILEMIENFSAINSELLESTKLYSLFTLLVKLSDIPLDEKYDFSSRFSTLLLQFQAFVKPKTMTNNVSTAPIGKNAQVNTEAARPSVITT